MNDLTLDSSPQITFLYYYDLEPIAEFYESVLGLDLVTDQRVAKIYRVNSSAYVGIVDGEEGHLEPQESSAVLLTVVVEDVPAWHAHLKSQGVEGLTEIERGKHVESFFFRDPGGYAWEMQRFLAPEVSRRFWNERG